MVVEGGLVGAGRPGWVVWWCAPRPGCGLERERGVVLRERERREVWAWTRSL